MLRYQQSKSLPGARDMSYPNVDSGWLPRRPFSTVVALLIALLPALRQSTAEVAGDACSTFNHATIFGPIERPFWPDEFTSDLAGSGSTFVAGAPIDGYPTELHGALFVYTRGNGNWSFQQKLVATHETPVQHFGASVAISGNTIIAGVPDAVVDGVSAGAVFVFERVGTSWFQQQAIHASNAAPNQYFGYAVAISGDTILVGAPGEDAITGAAYAFTRAGTTWSQQARLIASDRRSRDGFGWSVSTDGKSLIAGSSAHGFESGVGYVFESSGAGWTQTALLVPPRKLYLGQEIVVSISGDWAAINHRQPPRGVNLYQRGSGTWEYRQTLQAQDPILESSFGQSFVLNETHLTVGSRRVDGTNAQGLVHVYRFDGTGWGETQLLTPLVTATAASFGRKVALSESAIFVSSWGRSISGAAYGVGYAFDSDLTPPSIHSVMAEPKFLFPPNNKLQPVRIIPNATDACGGVSCRIASIETNDEPGDKHHASDTGDSEITGDLSALLRATRPRHGLTRIYTIHLECTDDVGNVATSSVDVAVSRPQ